MTASNNAAASSKEVGEKLKQVTDYVKDCDRRVNRGEIMDLQGLDKTVMEICDAMAQLPEDEVEKHEAAMSALIKDLETLAKSMKAQQALQGGEG
jgi:hypothetical protein